MTGRELLQGNSLHQALCGEVDGVDAPPFTLGADAALGPLARRGGGEPERG